MTGEQNRGLKSHLIYFKIIFKTRLSLLMDKPIIGTRFYGRRPSVTSSAIPGQMGNQAAQWSNDGYIGNLRPPFFLGQSISQQQAFL